MYAVIQTGGKQYRVAPGDTIRIERVSGEVGEKVTFGSVLAARLRRLCVACARPGPTSRCRHAPASAPTSLPSLGSVRSSIGIAGMRSRPTSW